jgi:eukaryotic-like serine/threonine-protein kinase
VLAGPEPCRPEVAHFFFFEGLSPVCPDETTLSRYASGQGPDAERAALESHVDGCGECRAVVALLAQTLAVTAPSGRLQDPDLDLVLRFERLGESYDIESVLGAGGMGVVVGATHRVLGHHVAIKVLRPSLRLHPGAEQRFLKEARAGARLTSPHIARVLDAGRTPDGLPFLVMERLVGQDGERFLSSHGLPTLAETLDLTVQVLSALAEAHSLGLVHRDLKPANLFLRRLPSGRLDVKVLDFGLAKVMGDDLGLTSSQGFLGSPLYIAPEQLRGASDVDARADVWGVGCLLYRFVSGRVPFPAASLAEVVTRIQRDEPTPLMTLRPEVPEALSVLVGQLLEKAPLKRPASVIEVGLRLRPLMTGRPAVELEDLLLLPVRDIAVPVSPATPAPSRWLAAAVALLLGVTSGAIGVRALTPEPAGPPRVDAPPVGVTSSLDPKPAVTGLEGRPSVAEPPPVVAPTVRTTASAPLKQRGMLARDAGAETQADVFEGRE